MKAKKAIMYFERARRKLVGVLQMRQHVCIGSTEKFIYPNIPMENPRLQ
jgi:hypothetical protein